MKKQKRNSIVAILLFVLLLAAGIYTVIYGIGDECLGRAKDIKLGLDLAGGVSITYEIVDENPSSDDIADTIYRLQQRVDNYSSEGEVYQEGSNRISIEIPGATNQEDANEILEALGKPGNLEFLDETNYSLWAQGSEYEALLTGSDVKSATASIDNSTTTKSYLVELSFTEEGSAKFAEATTNNIGKCIYIIYDNEVVSSPIVEAAITSGNPVINKISTIEEAQDLATTIRIGALPLELKELRSNVVGAKLGEDAISTSLKAGLIGVIIVCLIMIVVYLLPGVVSALALVAYIVLTLLCLNVFDITLTLPGMAGIILTVGMAVDANVIIFTRIKEEIRDGKSVKQAIEGGFSKALSAIIDGNVTTLIAAAILFWRGTGTIKGFASTLALGIVLSMFSALIITKTLLKAVCTLGLNKPSMYGKAKTAKYVNYTKMSKICLICSALVILLGFIFLPINKNNPNIGNILNYSLDFMGGTSISVTFGETYTLEEAETLIRPVVAEAAGISESEIQLQNVTDSNEIIIKTPELSGEQGGQREAVEAALQENFTVEEYQVESISATISGEMRNDAILSVALAAVLMLAYIAVRFKDVKFGAGAVLALLHDVLVVFTLYAVARLSVGNTFIACMLTILGYSINATIIVFDRVRENLNSMNPKKEGLDVIVNTSICQTFTRNIFTSLTTFVMVLILYIMGVPSIKEFSLALMAGVVCGGYSSICIAGPLWWILKTKLVKKENK